MTSRECRRCATQRNADDFYQHRAVCKPCIRAERRLRWHEKPLEERRYQRNRHLRSNYGMTLVDYEEMLTSQLGSCAICGAAPPENASRFGVLHVDHNHVTGAIRGLLCQNCNRGLGMFNDDPTRLLQAAEYVSKHETTTQPTFLVRQ